MGRKEKLHCDECEKESKDICGDEDWIRFEANVGTLNIAISGKRDESKTHHCKSYISNKERLDFCSVECMLKYMKIEKTRKILRPFVDVFEGTVTLVDLDNTEQMEKIQENYSAVISTRDEMIELLQKLKTGWDEEIYDGPIILAVKKEEQIEKETEEKVNEKKYNRVGFDTSFGFAYIDVDDRRNRT